MKRIGNQISRQIAKECHKTFVDHDITAKTVQEKLDELYGAQMIIAVAEWLGFKGQKIKNGTGQRGDPKRVTDCPFNGFLHLL